MTTGQIAVDGCVMVLDEPQYFLTAGVCGENEIEVEVAGNDSPVYLIGLAAKYVVSDLLGDMEGSYRVFDNDGSEVAAISIHTLSKVAPEWGIDVEQAFQDVLARNF